MTMQPCPGYAGHRFPGEIISYAVWLYFRFPLSLRHVDEILAARGITVSHETVRQWGLKFGQSIANQIRRRLPHAGDTWHLDEVAVRIAEKKHWLWRAVDQDGVVLDILVQSRRDKHAAKRLLRKLLKKQSKTACPLCRLRSLALLCRIGGDCPDGLGRSSRHRGRGMRRDSEAFIGIDTAKARNAVAIAEGGRHGEIRYLGEFDNTPEAVSKLVRRLAERHGTLNFCYEAGPTGYGLHRQILSLKHSCIVVAPSLIPRRSGDRVKTNRRDAESLARLLRAGELTPVWVPDETHEAVRDLVRT